MADDEGTIFEHPHLEMAGASGREPCRIRREDLIPLPMEGKLFFLPGCRPIGWNPSSKRFQTVESMEDGEREFRCHAVSAFLEPGFVRLLLPAADYVGRESPLPLWAYSAVGFLNGQFRVPAFVVQYDHRWDPANFDDRDLLPRIDRASGAFPGNRLVAHLARCACDYHCFAAKNFFLGRWEMPLPVSRGCNASCIGCISLQPPGGFPASHERIAFTPTVEEIVEIAVPHLEGAEEPIASFGQGCEGEPLTEAALLEGAVREIRRKTSRGMINLNTNGAYPDRVERLCRAGLDSIRISLSSARRELYHRYFLPKDYDFADVVRSIGTARSLGVFTMVNYLVFPGISDQPAEIEAMIDLIGGTDVQYIHLKNLNIDPDVYLAGMRPPAEAGIGIRNMMKELKKAFPRIRFGYFNRPAAP